MTKNIVYYKNRAYVIIGYNEVFDMYIVRECNRLFITLIPVECV